MTRMPSCLLPVSVLLLFSTACATAGVVSLTMEETAGVPRKAWPVTSGVPYPSGALRTDAKVALVDEKGAAVPFEKRVLARWRDGSVLCLLLDFQIDLAAGERALRL